MPSKSDARPVIKTPLSAKDKLWEAIALIGILFSLYLLLDYNSLPDTVPRHFNASGQADAWGSKKGFLLLPIISIVLYVGLTILNRYPHKFNYPFEITEENARRQYGLARSLICLIKMEVVWMFTYLEWQTIQVSLGHKTELGILFLPIILIITFGTLGIYIYQSYRARQ